jgi:hypothetical protein
MAAITFTVTIEYRVRQYISRRTGISMVRLDVITTMSGTTRTHTIISGLLKPCTVNRIEQYFDRLSQQETPFS